MSANLEERVRTLENTMQAINTTIKNFGVFICVLGSMVILMLGVISWEFNRLVSHNDMLDDKQSDLLVDMRLDYTRGIERLSTKVEHLENIINSHFKD